EVENCVFECVKRGDVAKYLAQAQAAAQAAGESFRVGDKIDDMMEKVKRSKDRVERFSEEKDHLLKENNRLKRELDLTKDSLHSAVENFKRVFEDQVQSSRELKELNRELGLNAAQMEEDNKQMRIIFNKLKTFNSELEKRVEARTSELKDANIQLEKSKDDLEKSYDEIKKSNDALEKIQQERSLFFANLSHELRTPLNAILGFSQILQSVKKGRDKTEKEYIDSINTSGRSLLRLVNSVHDFTKVELGELKVEKKKCNLEKVLKSISLFFKNEAINKGLHFEFKLDDGVPSFIETDELALKQVLDNLLSNALKFTKEGQINLKAQAKFKEDRENSVDLFIQVEDTGVGMPLEKVEKLFEPFSQVHEHGSVQERGSGLGLFISDKIIRDLGGRLFAFSAVGKGSSFNIEIPDISFSKEESDTRNLFYNFFGETVLFADDFPLNVKLYKAYLSRHNLKVESAMDGEELLEKVRKINPDLIVTDFDMPKLNADKVLETLRAENFETPVILVSALKMDRTIQKEFHGFLQKPVDEDSFIKEVARFLKHEVTIIEEEEKVESYDFDIPENLSKEELQLVKEIYEKLKKWQSFMPVSEIENEIPGLRKKVKSTKLNVLTPILKKLEENAGNFNINVIKSLLNQFIEKIQKY
ncbi:MAG: ATP-binding protein, partial [Bdellovibrionota bacterium]|nr:ATP-binding protein [Bdellovibrionota bacterium]